MPSRVDPVKYVVSLLESASGAMVQFVRCGSIRPARYAA